MSSLAPRAGAARKVGDCPACRYALLGLPVVAGYVQCPECGSLIEAEVRASEPAGRPPRDWPLWVVALIHVYDDGRVPLAALFVAFCVAVLIEPLAGGAVAVVAAVYGWRRLRGWMDEEAAWVIGPMGALAGVVAAAGLFVGWLVRGG